jgi:hypothetical protein
MRTETAPAPSGPLAAPQTARFRARAGRFEVDTGVQVTPLGLLAIGGLVSAILLSVPPIVRAAGNARRPRG